MFLLHQGFRRSRSPMDYNQLLSSWRNLVMEKILGGKSSNPKKGLSGFEFEGSS
jgi:hypothetical protein